jgi:hypothetical protein
MITDLLEQLAASIFIRKNEFSASTLCSLAVITGKLIFTRDFIPAAFLLKSVPTCVDVMTENC